MTCKYSYCSRLTSVTIPNNDQVRQDTLGAIDTKGLVLVVQKQANAYIYRLNPNLTRP